MDRAKGVRQGTYPMFPCRIPSFVDWDYRTDSSSAHFHCCTSLKRPVRDARITPIVTLSSNSQSTTEDMIHMYSAPVRLMLLACRTMIEASVLGRESTSIDGDARIHVRGGVNDDHPCFRIHLGQLLFNVNRIDALQTKDGQYRESRQRQICRTSSLLDINQHHWEDK